MTFKRFSLFFKKFISQGAKTVMSREEAGSIVAGAGDFVKGDEPSDSVDTWHYDHLKM